MIVGRIPGGPGEREREGEREGEGEGVCHSMPYFTHNVGHWATNEIDSVDKWLYESKILSQMHWVSLSRPTTT